MLTPVKGNCCSGSRLGRVCEYVGDYGTISKNKDKYRSNMAEFFGGGREENIEKPKM